jgi:hypothetical protein
VARLVWLAVVWSMGGGSLVVVRPAAALLLRSKVRRAGGPFVITVADPASGGPRVSGVGPIPARSKVRRASGPSVITGGIRGADRCSCGGRADRFGVGNCTESRTDPGFRVDRCPQVLGPPACAAAVAPHWWCVANRGML